MEELSKDFEVYAIDLRGFGDSSYNKEINSLFDLSLDVADFITKKLLNDITILGWSAGGGVCLELLANPTIQSRINSCILLSSIGVKGLKGFEKPTYFNYPFFFEPFNLEKINENLQEKFFMATENMRNLYSKLKIDDLEIRRKATEEIFKHYVYNVKKIDEEELNRNIEAALKQRNQVEINRALNSFNIVDNNKINNIKVPILMLHGLKDIVVRPYVAQKSAELLGNRTSLKIFEYAGHSLMTDSFKKYISEIKNFTSKY
ncbi:alpha/beta hydrolase [Anaerosphaera aminiphila]